MAKEKLLRLLHLTLPNSWVEVKAIKNLSGLETALLSLICFVMPMQKQIIPYAIALFLLVFLIKGGIRRILTLEKWNKYTIVTTTFYLVLVLGLIHTEEMDEGLFDLEVKFSLLLFPLLIPVIKLSEAGLDKIFRWFIAGCLAVCIICSIVALKSYQESADLTVFYYQKYSVFHHPAYFSMYLNFCIIYLFYLLLFRKSASFGMEFLILILIVFFAVNIILLSAKIGMITFGLIFLSGGILWLIKSRAFIQVAAIGALAITFFYLSYKYSTIMNVRIKEAMSSVKDGKETYSTTGARMLIWKTALEMISQKAIFGYGTGDVKKELISRYKLKKYDVLVQYRLNAHNQYLQVMLAVGIAGSLSFFLYLLYPLISKSFYQNLPYLGFLFLIAVNFLAESMLETQAGVVFYAFFNALLYFNRDKIAVLKLKRDK